MTQNVTQTMILLPGNCRAGKFSVYPSNWKTTKANKSLNWRISYWFIDDSIKKRKKITLKGMNRFETLREKQDAVRGILKDELRELKDLGYNHITKHYLNPEDPNLISELTPFVEALDFAFEKLICEHQTKRDVASCLRTIKKAIDNLRYDSLTISQVRRKHIRFILEECGKIKTKWSANQFNYHRAHLSMLFKVLVDLDVVDVNPVKQILKQNKVQKIRETLTDDQRKLVNDHLFKNNYEFWRFVQIFFHSGAREIELLRVRKNDVYLNKQQFKVLVKKGAKKREELRTIKTIALPLWKELYNLATGNQVLFSRKLLPGNKIIRREQITKRWKVHVKDKLSVTGDLYSLKHSALDETTALLSLIEASKQAGHTSIDTTLIYTVNEQQRRHERLKDLNNPF